MFRITTIALLLLAAIAAAGPAVVAAAGPTTGPADAPDRPASTSHQLTLADGRRIDYTADVGYLNLDDEAGRPWAKMFYIAYTLDGAKAEDRPILFAFNGGPGAASLWLHIGGLGPKRVILPQDGTRLPAKIELVDNPHSWLAFADLVFIDPVGSGFSTPAKGVDAEQFFRMETDFRATGEFVRLYLAKTRRWRSPKFLTGESYGTTRAIGVAGYLQQRYAINMRGLVLLSAAINFQAIQFGQGNDLPYMLYLPSYTAVAWYHHRLDDKLQADLPAALAESERFAVERYNPALARGSDLPDDQRPALLESLSRLTGLGRDYLAVSDLRVPQFRFAKQLLAEQHKIVGVIDGRVTGLPLDPVASYPGYDPSLFVVSGPLVAAMQDYIERDFGYATTLPYEYLSSKANRSWDWGSARQGYPNVTDTLAAVMTKDQRLRVFGGAGYFDLTTGYFAQRYMYSHLPIAPELRDHLTVKFYHSGHQLYVHARSREQLFADVAAWLAEATADRPR